MGRLWTCQLAVVTFSLHYFPAVYFREQFTGSLPFENWETGAPEGHRILLTPELIHGPTWPPRAAACGPGLCPLFGRPCPRVTSRPATSKSSPFIQPLLSPNTAGTLVSPCLLLQCLSCLLPWQTSAHLAWPCLRATFSRRPPPSSAYEEKLKSPSFTSPAKPGASQE